MISGFILSSWFLMDDFSIDFPYLSEELLALNFLFRTMLQIILLDTILLT